MSSSDLNQPEADRLLGMPKRPIEVGAWRLPTPGRRLTTELVSLDGREQFVLDQYRGRIKITKRTSQNRARGSAVLAWLDLDGPPHRNPDGTELGHNHLHLYREGYGDKWAMEVPQSRFNDLSNPLQTLLEFLEFCGVVGIVAQEPALF